MVARRFFALLFLAAALSLLCSCAPTQSTSPAGSGSSNSSADGSQAGEDPSGSSASKPPAGGFETLAGVSARLTVPYQELTARCGYGIIGNFIWLSEDELLLEGYDYTMLEDRVDYHVGWFLWNIEEDQLSPLYKFDTNDWQQLSAASWDGGLLQLTAFGGEHLTLDPENQTVVKEPNSNVNGLDPLTTFYDAGSGALFYFEDHQIWRSCGGSTVPICRLDASHFPRTLTLSPDKKTFAFVSVRWDAFVREIVTVDMESLAVTRIEKECVMPFACWLDDQLCLIENLNEMVGDVDVAISRFYYGPKLAQNYDIVYPDPNNFFVHFESGFYNLGQQDGMIPMVREYKAENGDWRAELGFLYPENGAPVIRVLVEGKEENFLRFALSPGGTRLLMRHCGAFTGQNDRITIFDV